LPPEYVPDFIRFEGLYLQNYTMHGL